MNHAPRACLVVVCACLLQIVFISSIYCRGRVCQHSLFPLLSENSCRLLARNWTIPLQIGGGGFIFQKAICFLCAFVSTKCHRSCRPNLQEIVLCYLRCDVLNINLTSGHWSKKGVNFLIEISFSWLIKVDTVFGELSKIITPDMSACTWRNTWLIVHFEDLTGPGLTVPQP